MAGSHTLPACASRVCLRLIALFFWEHRSRQIVGILDTNPASEALLFSMQYQRPLPPPQGVSGNVIGNVVSLDGSKKSLYVEDKGVRFCDADLAGSELPAEQSGDQELAEKMHQQINYLKMVVEYTVNCRDDPPALLFSVWEECEVLLLRLWPSSDMPFCRCSTAISQREHSRSRLP